MSELNAETRPVFNRLMALVTNPDNPNAPHYSDAFNVADGMAIHADDAKTRRVYTAIRDYLAPFVCV